MSTQVQTPHALPVDRTNDRGRNILGWASKNAVYVALVALFIFNLIATRGFASAFTLQNLLFSAAPLILIAVGQTLVIGTGGIDLSVGSVMAFSSATIALYLGYGETATLLIAIAAAAAIGLVNGSLIAFARINPLITGLGLLVAVRGLAQAISGGSRSPIPSGGMFSEIGNASVMGIPGVALLALAATAVFIVVVRRTTFGRYALFAGSNRSAAFLAGTPRNSTLIGVYVASATLAGIAGVMVSARIGASDPSFIGINFELTAIAAVVIGGTPLAGGRMSILGAAAAAVFLQLIDTTFVMQGINPAFSQVLKAVLIIVALYMQRSRKDTR